MIRNLGSGVAVSILSATVQFNLPRLDNQMYPSPTLHLLGFPDVTQRMIAKHTAKEWVGLISERAEASSLATHVPCPARATNPQ